jgi:hypothetical protein
MGGCAVRTAECGQRLAALKGAETGSVAQLAGTLGAGLRLG